MSEFFTQTQRLLAVFTNAGTDVLLIDKLEVREGVSQPFRMTLRMVAERAAGSPDKVKPHQLVGTSFSVRLALSEAGTGVTSGERYWNGMCERFVQENEDDQFSYYSAVLTPWFGFLHYTTDCRIFQDKTVPDIITEVVGSNGYSALLRMELSRTYTRRDYCVQYRESDLDFLSRLMESEGIRYYFEHSSGKHVMVLSDPPSPYKPMPIKSSFHYAPSDGGEATEDNIRRWRLEEEMHTAKWSYRDFHHEAPTNRFDVMNPSTDVAAEGTKFEIFDYPGDYAKKFNQVGSVGGVRPEGETTARLRMEKEETYHTVMSGASKCRVFTTGYKFEVVSKSFQAGSYLLIEARHSANQVPAYGNTEPVADPYSNSFRAIPATRAFVPVVHIHAGVHGLQTAIVIDESPSGKTEEIWPDKYGRVRVRFHWDREAKYACWLRVVQPWAGRAWGQQWIPRVGDEVAVTFLEGDPDCPVIMGGLYNSDNMPVFSLPANKTQSGILTHSTPGGASSNFNMLRFEDKIGSEEIHVQAEKDLNSLVKNDETRTVGDNRTTTIHVNDTRTVETGQDVVTVQQGNQTVTVHQKITTVSETSDINTTANQNMTSTTQVGDITIQAQAGHVTITSPASITLRCGASSIVLNPSEIRILTPMKNVN